LEGWGRRIEERGMRVKGEEKTYTAAEMKGVGEFGFDFDDFVLAEIGEFEGRQCDHCGEEIVSVIFPLIYTKPQHPKACFGR
jgi:hypothetical protein